MIFGKKSDDKEHGAADFTGRWFSTFGPLDIREERGNLLGTYRFGNVTGELEGTVRDRRLSFRYHEPNVSGEGWFDIQRFGRFSGKWRPDGESRWLDWIGERGFDGIWNSTFGPLKLAVEEGGTVKGFYEMQGPSFIEGKMSGNELAFTYREPTASGRGTFRLDDDGRTFSGQWLQDGQRTGQTWEGGRLFPQSGIMWLVVLEAHWQRYLQEREYSFGEMLDAFFARNPRVNVRHRFFSDSEGLGTWARGLMYMPEPVVLVIAAHGSEEGLRAGGEIIRPEPFIDGLRYADSIVLTHFSSCLMLNHHGGDGLAARLRDLNRFPVSGYGTTVNWAASAIIEFTYLNFIFEQGLAPEEASGEILRSLKFAGDKVHDSSPFPAAGSSSWRRNDARYGPGSLHELHPYGKNQALLPAVHEAEDVAVECFSVENHLPPAGSPVEEKPTLHYDGVHGVDDGVRFIFLYHGTALIVIDPVLTFLAASENVPVEDRDKHIHTGPDPGEKLQSRRHTVTEGKGRIVQFRGVLREEIKLVLSSPPDLVRTPGDMGEPQKERIEVNVPVEAVVDHFVRLVVILVESPRGMGALVLGSRREEKAMLSRREGFPGPFEKGESAPVVVGKDSLVEALLIARLDEAAQAEIPQTEIVTHLHRRDTAVLGIRGGKIGVGIHAVHGEGVGGETHRHHQGKDCFHHGIYPSSISMPGDLVNDYRTAPARKHAVSSSSLLPGQAIYLLENMTR
ncbi:MAG: hypothetical protein C4529_02900 [Deltaproteobacteria bacterium]|nr:MAG: hypothetical protein C4529_02900 [Deltaproteobacteria bacterium]